MTVVSTIMTKDYTVHASDSLITGPGPGGSRVSKEAQKSKIVRVPQWHGAMSYWGLALYGDYNWSTLAWLQQQAQYDPICSSSEKFARELSTKLQNELNNMKFTNATAAGIGIHLTAYENVDTYWIPELFLISNWADTSYRSLRPDGIGLTRETYHTLACVPPDPEHREPRFRLAVHRGLHEHNIMLRYNNGDPVLFNLAANAIHGMSDELRKRGILREPESTRTHLRIARLPVETVSNAQRDLCEKDAKVVGGKIHDLAISPRGEYQSSSGD